MTDPDELREHLAHMRRRQRIARLTGDNSRLWWLNIYVPMLEARISRAEAHAITAA